MPIKPENRKRYPKDWKEIRLQALIRAGHKCQGSPMYPGCQVSNYSINQDTGSMVVLTIAHLNHTPEDNRPENLRAWCQRCHLTYDAKHHAMNAARTRHDKANTLDMFTDRAETRKTPKSKHRRGRIQ